MTRCCWDMRHLAQVRRGTGLDMPSRYALKHSHEIFGQSTVVDPSCAITCHFSSIRSNKSEKLSIFGNRTFEYWNVKLRKSLARRTPKPLRRKVSGSC
ncbi:hypothetical protein T12_8094 [Trichinella patagoniensis]|uniref:Uncharacterized protein n=1 Tax=Trichinella patagoniensis TaxID=990121 RepID=A0A0V0ZZM9_9BILA|nr:hypothetical protein T12_9729 [Trichinella patagoniensis]KRY17997.1 hypothetical protein T12_8094 [Trichinella patagoniensis]